MSSLHSQYTPNRFSQKRIPSNGTIVQRENRHTGCIRILRFTQHGDYRRLIHNIKYKGEKRCGKYLGSLFASELLKEGKLQDIDIIAPVPLHHSRERARGYNQSEWVAKGIADVIGKEVYPHLLCRRKKNESQTHKSLYERWLNTHSAFYVQETSKIKDKHILLVDDVVTTGATLLACAEALLNSWKL
ncbi:MAG: phosphoribosyltransferase family protein [Coprobacter fastidiosus]